MRLGCAEKNGWCLVGGEVEFFAYLVLDVFDGLCSVGVYDEFFFLEEFECGEGFGVVVV